MMMKMVAYTDGACEKSPRIGGWGWTAITSQINKGKKCVIEWSDHGGLNDTTNQQMELMAMAELLEFCNIGSDIEIWSDSTYTVKGIVGEITKNPQEQNLKSYLVTLKSRPQGWLNGWKTSRSILNAPYTSYKNDQIGYWNTDRTNGYEWYRIHQRLLLHIKGKSIINFGWVKGHSGIEGNEKADKLADIYKDSKTEKELKKIVEKLKTKPIVFDDKTAPYYAVARGVKPGIYRTWSECLAQTNGFPGQKYKKFMTLADANQFMIS